MELDPHRKDAGTTRGYLLARARHARGWNQSELARHLRAHSRKRGRPLHTRRDGVWYWEHDRTPDLPTQRLIADLLGIPPGAVDARPWPEWLSEDPAQRPTPRPWTLLGASQSLTELARGSAMDVTRRELVLIAGGTLTASLLAWLTADPVAAGQLTTGRRIGEAAVAKIEDRAQMLRRMDDEDGGGTVLAEASSALALVHGLIRDRSYTDAHGARLYAAASDLARQRAAALFDVKGECADGTFDTALRAARVAGDNALGANALSFWSVSAYNTGRLHDAEDMANTALASIRGTTTPRVQALFLTRRGRARAHLGDTRCWTDFDRAEALLTQADGHTDPDWSYWFNQAEILGARASSHRDMNQPGPAEAAFAQAHALFAPTSVRTHALYLSRQADAQFAQGQIERACATADAALDLTETISSHRTVAPLLNLAERLAPYPVPDARDFRERARTTLAA
ncbi:transcriptional regulator [Streptomyces sp. SID5475]|nr:transcriptional regulator [Streptomyces sp. SID5475]